MLIDIRAKEIANWRKSARHLANALADIEETAIVNDKIVLALHKVALALISNKAQWCNDIEQILEKQLSIARCRVLIFDNKTDNLYKISNRLPAKGLIVETAIIDTLEYKGAKSYFYLPLKKNKQLCGILVLAEKKPNAYPHDASNDLVRRLGELIIAKL